MIITLLAVAAASLLTAALSADADCAGTADSVAFVSESCGGDSIDGHSAGTSGTRLAAHAARSYPRRVVALAVGVQVARHRLVDGGRPLWIVQP